jgi:hypothetical protein
MKRLLVCLGLGLCMLAATQTPASPQVVSARVALVIGNSAYSGIWPDLRGGPLRDALLMRDVLTALKFEVLYVPDADQPRMEQALEDFRRALLKHPGALALAYFSGHGTQAPVRRTTGGLDVENFVIPARTDLRRESEVKYKAIAQSQIEDVIRSANAFEGVIVLDACRDNGLERDMRAGDVRGLVARFSTDMLVVYAARAGRWAYNTPGAPSIFTSILAGELRGPGTLLAALYRVHDRVVAETQWHERGAQEPEILARIGNDVTLADEPPVRAPVSPPAVDPRSLELAYWNSVDLRNLAPPGRARVCGDYLGRVQRSEFPGTFRVVAEQLCAEAGVAVASSGAAAPPSAASALPLAAVTPQAGAGQAAALPPASTPPSHEAPRPAISAQDHGAPPSLIPSAATAPPPPQGSPAGGQTAPQPVEPAAGSDVDPEIIKAVRAHGYRPQDHNPALYCRKEKRMGSLLPITLCGTASQIYHRMQSDQEWMGRVQGQGNH